MKSKVETFIGFSIKARKIAIGEFACEREKKMKSLFICDTASENAKGKAESLAKKANVPLILVKGKTVEEIIGKENCKIFALTDENLSSSAIANLDGNYKIILGG